ncbi:DNA alkylation repair protein [Mechercharimyces sp. CAU 1602]|uniref:DNA alkylation repair protein n=1 Tax=Mechercharimyces sp. CAU 1602 TaxID=2973933 RepID=UPI002163A8CB|nr:DNA alkylation repair protein [Mechercharimyces sp. CAU 1602]MCS1351520.1 DNA alkylation repair protein [Mechercharimyces sp. CAU 1602]
MATPYLCPTCGTNRTRFNLIEQVAQSVKKDPQTGDITETIIAPDPLHIFYQGASYLVQCGVCGQVETEERFIKSAQAQPMPFLYS